MIFVYGGLFYCRILYIWCRLKHNPTTVYRHSISVSEHLRFCRLTVGIAASFGYDYAIYAQQITFRSRVFTPDIIRIRTEITRRVVSLLDLVSSCACALGRKQPETKNRAP